MTNGGIEEFVDGADTPSGKNVFTTDMRKTFLQVDQKLDLAIGSRRKTGQATLGREHAILPAIPEKKRLTQAGADRHQRPGSIRLQRLPGSGRPGLSREACPGSRPWQQHH